MSHTRVSADVDLFSTSKRGKSEAPIQCAGKGMALARRERQVVHANQVSFVSCGRALVLLVLRDSNPLGTRNAAAGHMVPEVSVNTAILKQVASSMRRRLFASEAMPAQKRLQHGRMLVLSKGLFQVGAWPRLSTAQEMSGLGS